MLELLFWGSVAAVAYGYLGYPLLLLCLAALRPRPVHRAPVEPSVTLIIAVRNEERVIADKLENSLRLDYPSEKIQILVASDCSLDRTHDIVLGYRGRGVELVATSQRRGKEFAQHQAIKRALGEILVFTDATIMLDRDALRSLVSHFNDPSVGCVSCEDVLAAGARTGTAESLYSRYDMWVRRLESRVGSVVGLSGFCFAARRHLCQEWPHTLASDFFLLLNTVRHGYRGVGDPMTRGHYETVKSLQQEFRRKTRTILRGMTVFMHALDLLNPLRHGLFAFQLASHKLFKWLVPLWLGVALAANLQLLADSIVYRLTGAGQAAFYLTALLGLAIPPLNRLRPVRVASYFLTANAAVAVAGIQYLTGKRIVFWEPSRRTPDQTESRPQHPLHAPVQRPMTIRICHVIAGNQWAGAEAQAAHLLTGLARREGLEVSAILFAEGLLARDLRRLGIPITVLEERELGRLGLLRAMANALRTHRPHILHTHRYKENILGGVAGRWAGVPCFVRTEHGHVEPFRGLDRLKMAVYEGMDELFARYGTDGIIAVSRDLHSELARRAPRARVTLILNGLDAARMTIATPPAQLRKELGIGPDAPVFGTAGRLVPVKGLTSFLSAARAILDKQPDARFLIVGEGPLRAELEDKARRAGIQQAVRFVGFRRDILDLINLMDVFVLPSLSEGRPMVLLEAMALGKPIVATAVGGIPDLLAMWRAAWFVPPGDERALTEACLQALNLARGAPGADPAGTSPFNPQEGYTLMCEQTHALYRGLARGEGG